MRMPRGPLYNTMKERVMVLRDRSPIDPNISGKIDFGTYDFDKSDVEIIIDRDNPLIMVIRKMKEQITPDGIALTDAEYMALNIPPNDKILVGDRIIRIDRNNEDLRITDLSEEPRFNIQAISMEKGGKIGTYRY